MLSSGASEKGAALYTALLVHCDVVGIMEHELNVEGRSRSFKLGIIRGDGFSHTIVCRQSMHTTARTEVSLQQQRSSVCKVPEGQRSNHSCNSSSERWLIPGERELCNYAERSFKFMLDGR